MLKPSTPSNELLSPFQQTQLFFNSSFNDHPPTNVETKSIITSPTTVTAALPSATNNINLQSFAVVQELQQQHQLQQHQLQQDQCQSNNQPQSRNHLGLLLPLNSDVASDFATTPTNPTRGKQGSPFYAEPADALGNVIRRSHRNVRLPANQRHSEPAKGPFRISALNGNNGTTYCQVLSPIESEKSQISGSLDELKKSNSRKARGRLDPWPLDSSWEFVGKEGDDNDYDTDANWKTSSQQSKPDMLRIPPVVLQSSRMNTVQKFQNTTKPLTVHQIICKRMPDLHLPELIKCSTPNASPELARSASGKYNRMSSYDNVEKGHHSGYATSYIGHDSTHSDDGTVFSEPWDSSQWDSFLPPDGKFKILYSISTHIKNVINVTLFIVQSTTFFQYYQCRCTQKQVLGNIS